MLSRAPADVVELQLPGEQRHMALACDATDPEAVDDAVKQLSTDLGAPTVLVNAAAINQDSLLMRAKVRDIEDMVRTNLLGPIFASKAVSKLMVQQRQGCIINIGSVVGSHGNAGQAVYSSTKASLIGLTKSLAKELGARNVRVNLVEPGFIQDGGMATATSDARLEQVIAATPLARAGTSEDVAGLVSYLASDSASFCCRRSSFTWRGSSGCPTLRSTSSTTTPF